MKKKYLAPIVGVDIISFEDNILSNVEDLNIRTYGSAEGESTDDIWS